MEKPSLKILGPHIKRMRKFEWKREFGGGNTVCAWLQTDKELRGYTDEVCHAFLRRALRTNETPLFVINKITTVVEEDVARRFYEWLFNYSPFRSVYITKSPKRAFDRGIVVSGCDVPANLMAGGMIALRCPWEDHWGNGIYKTTLMWDRLVHYGLHPNAAFVIASYLRSDGKYAYLNSGPSGHSVLNHRHRTFVTFLNDQPDYLMKPYNISKTYGSVWRTWDGEYGDMEGAVEPKLHNEIKNVLNNIKGEAVSNNPFKMAEINNNNRFPFNEAMEALAHHFTQYIKGMNIAKAA